MHQGKHQEYEKRLHDSLIAQMQQQSNQSTNGSGNNESLSPVSTAGSGSSSNGTSNGISKSNNSETIKDQTASVSSNSGTTNNGGSTNNEAWPSLSTSPVTIKENKMSTKGSELRISFCRPFFFTNFLFRLQRKS